MDDNWHTDDLNLQDRSRPITAIHLVAFSPWETAHSTFPPREVNDWYLFLELDNQTWIRLDVVPGLGDDELRCKIRLVSADRSYPPTVVHKRTSTVNGTMTLENLVETTHRNDRQKYKVTNVGEGRRHWYSTFIQDLEKGNVISANERPVHFEMSWFFMDKNACAASPIIEGTFLT
ncbi:hypothetical protein RRF57_001430 [Xylaria bambusicola]|uniref:DUF7770 domain-containing protein n=1 Tax=Xylaria bambusicola TaxID=326684 RepID=A0AAN7UQR2_9PEZI